MISVLVVDDEPPARRRVLAMLAGEADVEVVGECGNGAEAIEAIRRERPDLVFLDVQMPEVDGLSVVEQVGPEEMPPTVFVTAYDEYALRAFDAHAVDYLLKPFERERFERAFERARARLRSGEAGAEEGLRALVREIRGELPRPERIPVRVGARTRMLELADVCYAKAEGNYVSLHVGGRSYLLRETLGALESRLDPARFLRVHRSLIVNLAHVEEVESLFAGEYVLFLRGGARLTSGRTYRAALKRGLGITG